MNNIEEIFERYLQSGESFLWTGARYENKLLRVKRIAEAALGLLFVFGFNALFIFALKSPKVLIVGLPLLVAAAGIFALNVKGHKEYYAVTNMRVLKIRYGKFYAENLDNLTSVYTASRTDGGTNVYLVFKNSESFRAKITFGNDRGFNCMKKDEAEYVCELLSEKTGKK